MTHEQVEELRQDNDRLKARVTELEMKLRRFGNISKFPLWNHRQFQFKVDKITEWIGDQRGRKLGPGEEDFEALFLETFGMTYDYWIAERDFHLAFFQREPDQ